MKRTYKKRPLFAPERLGTFGVALFVLFIAYRILTPPSAETARVTSPDGTKTARLRTIYYYDDQPSYKIHWRSADEKAWEGLYYLPASTNTKGRAEADLAWSADSDRVDFLLNGTSIWHHVFLD